MKITYDSQNIPGIWAENISDAYYGLGFAHAKFRPLQVLLLGCAANGCLSEYIFANEDLEHLDILVKRLQLVEQAKAQLNQIDIETNLWFDAYLKGIHEGLQHTQWRFVLAKLPTFNRETLIAAFMLSAYLGLAEGQERMEKALHECLAQGGNPEVLQAMFAPHFQPEQPLTFQARDSAKGGSVKAVGGSNAWAITAAHSQNGKPILCGDPHLQINDLPSLFFEVRLRLPNNYWLGASIPGLPGIAVGRNRFIAFSGTFSCADNVDFLVPEITEALNITINRRFKKPRKVTLYKTADGECDEQKEAIAVWAGKRFAGQSLAAMMRLPQCESTAEASMLFHRMSTFALHFIVADCFNDVRYQQAGRIPKRVQGLSAIKKPWQHFCALPEERADDFVISANEARLSKDGDVLAPFAQPNYRYQRIEQLLKNKNLHNIQSMQAIQNDVYSLQAKKLTPLMLKHLPEGPIQKALSTWDFCYDLESKGAHAFHLTYQAMLQALHPLLGGEWFIHMLKQSELSVWWCNALDNFLHTTFKQPIQVTEQKLQVWGEVQTFDMPHKVLGNLIGCCKRNIALKGSIATISQGNILSMGNKPVAIGPAYRMVCDFSEDVLYTNMPGGIDGLCGSKTYTKWLNDWQNNRYHVLSPPHASEL